MVAVDHICVFFASSVSCEAISGSSVSSPCKCCKGAAGHGRLPVFYIVQTSFVNAQGKSWTGERMIETTRQKHIAIMPGCRVSVLLTNSEISIYHRKCGTIREKRV